MIKDSVVRNIQALYSIEALPDILFCVCARRAAGDSLLSTQY